MAWTSFWIILVTCSLSILAFRVVPLFLMSGKELSPQMQHALNLVPVAVFAALVANDMIPSSLAAFETIHGFMPLMAAVPTIIVAIKSRSLVWCIVVGLGAYSLLYFLF